LQRASHKRAVQSREADSNKDEVLSIHTGTHVTRETWTTFKSTAF
jgi:hypothetical protein